MLIAWCVHAFFDSFTSDSVWTQEGIDGATAVKYFQDEIIGTNTLPDDGTPTRIVGANAGYSLLVWFIVFMGIGFGVRWTGRCVTANDWKHNISLSHVCTNELLF